MSVFCLDNYSITKESGFYYLQSRYYDPSLGRFINADSYASTGQGFLGYNMFAYCGNNPVNGIDETGEFSVNKSWWEYELSGRDDDNGGTSAESCATTGTPYEVGRAGEDLAGIDQSAKRPIERNGRTRIPDVLTETTLTEVKNVNYISNTLQLRDYANYAITTERNLELFVRLTTRIAKTVIDAGWIIRTLW